MLRNCDPFASWKQKQVYIGDLFKATQIAGVYGVKEQTFMVIAFPSNQRDLRHCCKVRRLSDGKETIFATHWIADAILNNPDNRA